MIAPPNRQITLLYISCEIVSEGVSASVSLNSGQLTAQTPVPALLNPLSSLLH